MSTAPRLAAANRDWGHDETGCTVLHIDMDAFFASLEIARHPELAGKPVIIGMGPRSVVSAANYEARKYGINSAMASARARQLCPNGVFLPVDHTYYRQVSHTIFREIFSTVTDRIEQVSVDECYMDVSAALRTWGRPTHIGAWLRAQVAARFSITCSVGVAANKLVAKMASTNAKPDGMLLIPRERHADFVQMMPLRAIPGLGPAQERKLNEWGIDSVLKLAHTDVETLTRITRSASAAAHLHEAAWGRDARTVTPVTPEKSVGSEHTFDRDVAEVGTVADCLRRACDTVASTLRRRGLLGRTVTVKLRFPDLTYMTKSLTIDSPTDSAGALFPVTMRLLRRMLGMDDRATRLPRAVRLAGMSVSSLTERATTTVQPTLEEILEEDTAAQGTSKSTRMREAEGALDAIRRKYGKDSAQLGV
ncbi:DNA polymerase IV [Bifidobacterium cuniculi]|uniref:DNA polymerase IV n=1 Tax=Bifidobacterium cuniculi TaxID=1688 RepID=A0A087AYC0_9BIFI|nr:DNA polymerase IV [Bifidobacterium cuniculi]KFI63770.1 DNA-damage-inducible protein P [Bifidobacterium cuniculi]